ncbi:MAG: carboxypeptidase regulatory-like domain-containing protein, partial [Polyangiaceae bacterium]|nr:carboxypeptidase regulatory-like domain-containing protein [Polyangiaceae bacterium]
MNDATGHFMMQRMQRALALAGVLVGLLAAGPDARAQPAPPEEPGAIRIQVKGSAQIQGTAHSDARGFMIRGEVIDDAGTPVAGATVTIQASPLEGGGPRIALPEAVPCERRTRGPRVIRTAADTYSIDTDERGGFCVRGETPLPPAKIHMRFGATRLHDAAEAQVPLDTLEARAARTLLRFEPSIEVIDLDRESVPITASLRIERTDAPIEASTKREGLEVVLEDERGEKVATAVTGGDGRARFDLKTAALDAPGSGELRLRFDGTPGLARSAAAMPVVRRAEVKLALTHPLDSSDPEDGAPIDVDVTSARGPVSDGVVEAMRGA